MKKVTYEPLQEHIITATEAKNKLGAVLDLVVKDGASVLISQYGTPSAVIIPYTTYTQSVQPPKKKKHSISEFLKLSGSLHEQYLKNPIDVDNVRDIVIHADENDMHL